MMPIDRLSKFYFIHYYIHMKSKQIYSNKSGLIDKSNSNLVIKTQLQNSFDNRWAEIKIEGKNIASRSNHVAVIFGHSLFIHGGYDVDKGILNDFYEMDLNEDCDEYVWKKVNNTCGDKEIKLKGHTGIVYKERLFVYGGQITTNLSNNIVYIFDFVTKRWKAANSKGDAPRVDSHCSLLVQNKMYVYGGYISDKAQYLTSILAFNIDDCSWQIVYKGQKSEKQPEGRGNFSMVQFNNGLLIFGGTNGVKTLNDMWFFNIKEKKWTKIDTKDAPQARRGHSMINYQNLLFLFGGIQDVTKQKNDMYIYQHEKLQWSKIHTTTNSVYDCSPTLKKQSTAKSPQISPKRISPQKSDRTDNPMKKILSQNKQKKFQQRKRQLLKQFSAGSEGSKKRDLSPITESMMKTLESIGNQESNHKQIKQQIIYDDSHRFIIGKKPCARDGQSVSIYKNKMYIFGGDRHLMAFNDMYQFDLEKGVKSLELYKH